MKFDNLIKFLHAHNIKFTLVIGIIIIISWIIIAIFASFISPFDPNTLYLDNTFQYPNLIHFFGTDNYGRDIFSRVIHGSRLDLQMAFIGVVFPFIIGNFIGLLSGYFGGIIDSIIMRLLEITMSFPFFVLVIAIVSILGPGLKSFYIALALVGWVSYARLSRSQVLIVKNLDYGVHVGVVFKYKINNHYLLFDMRLFLGLNDIFFNPKNWTNIYYSSHKTKITGINLSIGYEI